MRTSRILPFLIAAILSAVLYCLPDEAHAATPTMAVPTSGTMPYVQAHTEPTMYRLVNCEDYDIQPCYTYDGGQWRMVVSYYPYKYVKLYKCTEEDGGKYLPCIWKDVNKVAKNAPKTRNVFVK